MATPRVAAGALFFGDGERVLLVRPSYKPDWEIPGGYVQPGETPRQACAREVHEELGIKPPIGRLLAVDWAPNADEGDKVLFVFDGGKLDDHERVRIRLDPAELTTHGFHEPIALNRLLTPRLARRIHAAVEAHRHGRIAYLEHGSSSG